MFFCFLSIDTGLGKTFCYPALKNSFCIFIRFVWLNCQSCIIKFLQNDNETGYNSTSTEHQMF